MTPALRAQVMREWRPFAATTPVIPRAGEALGALVPVVMKGLGLQKRLEESQIFHQWPQIVGPMIAKITRPYGLRHGRLEVHVNHSGYIQDVRPHKALMLEKINGAVGGSAVRDIIFRVG